MTAVIALDLGEVENDEVPHQGCEIGTERGGQLGRLSVGLVTMERKDALSK